METVITKELYELALLKVEQLLPQVDETTLSNDPKMVELCHYSDIIEQYETEH